MKIPRNVHGREFANHLIRRWQFRELHQTGSHIILRSEIPQRHTVAVPAHKPVKPGTLHGLLKYIARQKQITVGDLLRDL